MSDNKRNRNLHSTSLVCNAGFIRTQLLKNRIKHKHQNTPNNSGISHNSGNICWTNMRLNKAKLTILTKWFRTVMLRSKLPQHYFLAVMSNDRSAKER